MSQRKRRSRPPSLLHRVARRAEGLLRRLKRGSPRELTFRSGMVELALPPGHPLLIMQAENPLYDRFLPFLAGRLEAGALLVDVGANCGDTLGAVYGANRNLKFICVEPNAGFFSYLERNVGLLMKHDPAAVIHTVQALVGKKVASATLAVANGTSHAVEGVGGPAISSRTLDDILDSLRAGPLRLLKSDVDGFDFDVIDSAEGSIQESHPLIFFECQFEDDNQRSGYVRTISRLQAAGYSEWVVFDNFGEVVLKSSGIDSVLQLLNYLWRLNIGRSTRTVYYFDILAFGPRDIPFVEAVLGSYLQVPASDLG